MKDISPTKPIRARNILPLKLNPTTPALDAKDTLLTVELTFAARRCKLTALSKEKQAL